ncbi:MAG TPA: DUF6675 family protein [Spirochaetia bacterium]|nr:DUF6675 family protein [Spirochaetia bacterium]
MRIVRVAITAALAALATAVSAAAGDRLSAFVDSRDADGLRRGEVLTAAVVHGVPLRLVPQVSSAAAISEEVKSMDPSVGAELLKVIRGSGPQLDSPAGLLLLYNTVHAVSTMKGITYYSVTRGKQMPLFLQSYVIPAPDQAGTPQPDPVFEVIPPRDDLYTLQEDTSFGRNTYAEHVAALADHLYLKTENLTTISYLLVPIVTPRNFVSHVVVVPIGRDVLFYGVSCLKSGLPMGDLKSRTQSMENRLAAVAGWLSKRMQGMPGAAAAAGG